MSICISGCASICLDIHLFCRSTCLLFSFSARSSACLATHLAMHLAIWLLVQLQSVHLLVCRFWQSGNSSVLQHIWLLGCAFICICLHLHLSAILFCQSVLQDVHLLPAHLDAFLLDCLHICLPERISAVVRTFALLLEHLAVILPAYLAT